MMCSDGPTLDGGPFPIEADRGWRTLYASYPSSARLRNRGMGLIGYTWEENGPSIAVRDGRGSLRASIASMTSLPFVDVLYIRCDWRDVQSVGGSLDLGEVWHHTVAFARDAGLRIAFRIQASNPDRPDGRPALPDFLLDRIPMHEIGDARRKYGVRRMLEPDYGSPEYAKAFSELNELLAEKFNGDPSVEFVDLMMYGFWGEGHTGNLPSPFKSYAHARDTFLSLTALQLDVWDCAPLAVNLQPDISCVGNREVRELAMARGAWVRTDSVILEEPEQIGLLRNRPAECAAIVEDGSYRTYACELNVADPLCSYQAGKLDNMVAHALDAGANYWALWTEADNIRRYAAESDALAQLCSKIGYRVRPAWIWQRRLEHSSDLVISLVNDGVAGVPGQLRLSLYGRGRTLISSGLLPRGAPGPGGHIQVSMPVHDAALGSEAALELSIEDRARRSFPVAWGCRGVSVPGDRIAFGLARTDDEGWRSGI